MGHADEGPLFVHPTAADVNLEGHHGGGVVFHHHVAKAVGKGFEGVGARGRHKKKSGRKNEQGAGTLADDSIHTRSRW
jgi:hypothetical protein